MQSYIFELSILYVNVCLIEFNCIAHLLVYVCVQKEIIK